MKRYVTFKVKSGENTTNTLRIKTPTGRSITATIIYRNAIASFTLSGMDKYIDTTVPIDLDSAIDSLFVFKMINGKKSPHIIEVCDKIIDFISDYQDEIINNRINSSENSMSPKEADTPRKLDILKCTNNAIEDVVYNIPVHQNSNVNDVIVDALNQFNNAGLYNRLMVNRIDPRIIYITNSAEDDIRDNQVINNLHGFKICMVAIESSSKLLPLTRDDLCFKLLEIMRDECITPLVIIIKDVSMIHEIDGLYRIARDFEAPIIITEKVPDDYAGDVITNKLHKECIRKNISTKSLLPQEEPKDNLEEPVVKKYKFTGEYRSCDGSSVHQIVALRNIIIDDVLVATKGEIGGWVENEKNLSQTDDSWIYADSTVKGDSVISGKTIVSKSYISSKNDKSVRINSDKLIMVENSIINDTNLNSTDTHIINTTMLNNGEISLNNTIVLDQYISDNKGDIVYSNSPIVYFSRGTEEQGDGDYKRPSIVGNKTKDKGVDSFINRMVNERRRAKKEMVKIKDKTSDFYKDINRAQMDIKNSLNSYYGEK